MPNFSEPGPLTLSPAILSMLRDIPPYDARGHYAAPITSNATHPAYVTVEDLATCLPVALDAAQLTAAARDLSSATGTHVDPETIARRIAKPHLAVTLVDAVRAQLDPAAMLAADRRRILAGR